MRTQEPHIPYYSKGMMVRKGKANFHLLPVALLGGRRLQQFLMENRGRGQERNWSEAFVSEGQLGEGPREVSRLRVEVLLDLGQDKVGGWFVVLVFLF